MVRLHIFELSGRATGKAHDNLLYNVIGSETEVSLGSVLRKIRRLAPDLPALTPHGRFDLHYVRDRNKNEVDFLVTKEREPWFLVEAKASNSKGVSKSLHLFQEQLQVPHAFQVVFDLPYEEIDCFAHKKPVIVPASTFLSQLF